METVGKPHAKCLYLYFAYDRMGFMLLLKAYVAPPNKNSVAV